MPPPDGWAPLIVALVMIVYAFFGQYFPGLIAHPRLQPFRRIIGYLFLGTEGVFGMALNMSSTVIAIFAYFGSFLKYTGTGDFCDRFSRSPPLAVSVAVLQRSPLLPVRSSARCPARCGKWWRPARSPFR